MHKNTYSDKKSWDSNSFFRKKSFNNCEINNFLFISRHEKLFRGIGSMHIRLKHYSINEVDEAAAVAESPGWWPHALGSWGHCAGSPITRWPHALGSNVNNAIVQEVHPRQLHKVVVLRRQARRRKPLALLQGGRRIYFLKNLRQWMMTLRVWCDKLNAQRAPARRMTHFLKNLRQLMMALRVLCHVASYPAASLSLVTIRLEALS